MKKAILVVAGAVVLALVAGSAWALMRDDAESVARGTCGSASYELTVENDDEGLEVTYELQSSAPDETWLVLVEQGGTTLLEGERLTDEDAELDVDALGREDGADDFTVTATPAQGEPCVATLTR